MRRPILLVCFAGLLCGGAQANDSIAELGAGGIVLSRTDAIAMEREDLFVSMEKVEVDYVFRNQSHEDVNAIVAFPMPDIEASPWSMPSIPDDTQDNFLGFEVKVDGKPIALRLEHRAVALGIDVTDDLEAAGVPMFPYADAATDALAKLDDATAADWRDRGIIVIDEYDAGEGWQRVRSPFWKLRSTYWWRTVFPAGKAVPVWHRYRPAVGGTAGLSFFHDGKFQGETYAEYKSRYCMDDGFERGILKAARESKDGWPPLMENRVAYILKTGGNWAGGAIGRFTLTIDKGDARNIVSFCGEGVRKIGPTTFQMTKEDFWPERDLDILILTRSNHDGGAN